MKLFSKLKSILNFSSDLDDTVMRNNDKNVRNKSTKNTPNKTEKKLPDIRNIEVDITSHTIERSVNPLIFKKTNSGLLPGEIILLNWLDGKTERSITPQYFKYQYEVDTQISRKKLIDLGFIKKANYKKQLTTLTVPVLKEFLRHNDITPRGRKMEIIDQIIDEGIEVDNLPEVYELSKEGKNITMEYKFIISAHKDPHFDVANAIVFKEKLTPPYIYNDIKWAFFNNEVLKHTQNMNFGLLRNTHTGQADMLAKETKYKQALSYNILVALMDISGLSNSQEAFYDSIYITPGVYGAIEKMMYKGEFSKEDFNEAFDYAVRLFDTPKVFSLLVDEDVEFMRNAIFRMDLEDIKQYFKKYEHITIANHYGFSFDD